MGVPAFFKWILRNCNKTSTIIHSNINQRIDNFYLDTNGIIHPSCSQVLDKINYNLSQDKLEELMIENVIKNIDELINFVNPQKMVYIAIDGVAPFAKITQQRYRRYKSIYDENLKVSVKNKYNKFQHNWSNVCITPGTKFMEKLHNRILKYVLEKSNKLIIKYSSCYEVGEGEHKIIQYIKKNNSIYETILIYGLDADLLFLTMGLKHENVFLIREKANNKNDKLEYDYVDINELNKSIIKIICSYSNKLISSKNLVYDFIFICYLIGNDFLPHSPFIDIYDDGIENLIKIYVELKETNEYLINFNNNDPNINIIFFDEYLNKLSIMEKDIFFKNIQNKGKNRNKNRLNTNFEGYEKEIYLIENNIKQKDIYKNINNFDDYKYKYYEYYFYTSINQQKLIDNVCKNYIEGLLWVLKYYFVECCSWDWFFNYNVCPFINDIHKYIKNYKFNVNNIIFDIGKPLNPKHQLICVIPKKFIPEIISEYSEIINKECVGYMFPNEYELETEGKTILWKCNPIIPQININLIKKKFKI
jgi:5'-3' exonuclease